MFRGKASLFGLGLVVVGCAGPGARTQPVYLAPVWPDAPTDQRTAAAVGFAEAQIGKRYCWGGRGPDCFDCSGLVQAAWQWGGVKLPRTSDAQGRVLVEVAITQVRAGDILWWRGHVGLYIGRGEMIDAYHSGAGVVRRRAAMPERVLRVVRPYAGAGHDAPSTATTAAVDLAGDRIISTASSETAALD